MKGTTIHLPGTGLVAATAIMTVDTREATMEIVRHEVAEDMMTDAVQGETNMKVCNLAEA